MLKQTDLLECPECQEHYSQEYNYCIHDGSLLVAAENNTYEDWIKNLKDEIDRNKRGLMIIKNHVKLQNQAYFEKIWEQAESTYLKIDLLRFGPIEILDFIFNLGEIEKNPSLYLCFLKRCRTLDQMPDFWHQLNAPEFDSGLYLFLECLIKWGKMTRQELEPYTIHSDFDIRQLSSQDHHAHKMLLFPEGSFIQSSIG